MTTGLEKIRQKFFTEGLRTQRLARVFADADLRLQPAAGCMTCAELLAHIITSRNFLRGVFVESEPKTELFQIAVDTSSAAELCRQLAASWRAVVQAIDTSPEQWLQDKIAPFGPDWRMTRLDMAQLMIEHEIHHRGQLSVYARVAGKVPPDLYSPVSQDVLEDSPRG